MLELENIEQCINRIDELLSLYGINTIDIPNCIVNDDFIPFVANYNKGKGYSIITKDKKNVILIKSLIIARNNLLIAKKELLDSNKKMILEKKDIQE